MTRVGTFLAILVLSSAVTFAGDAKYVLNFDLNTILSDGSVGYSIQLQGIHISPDEAFHGDDLGKYEYFITVSSVEDGNGKLTIEFYEYETRKRVSLADSSPSPSRHFRHWTDRLRGKQTPRIARFSRKKRPDNILI